MKIPKWKLGVLVLLAALSYLFYTSYKDVKDSTLADFNTQQFALARQASKGIESFFIYYQRELNFLSNVSYISDLNDQGKELLKDFFINNSDQVDAITLVDKDGIILYTYPLIDDVIGKDISDQKHVKSILDSHKPTVSDVFKSLQGYETIAYHVPVMKNGVYSGSIAILIPIGELGKRFIENIRTCSNGYGWMISENGIELYSPQINHTGKPAREAYKNFPSVLNFIDSTSKSVTGTSTCWLSFPAEDTHNLKKTLSAYYRIPLGNTYWTIIIFTPEKEVFARLYSFRNRLYVLISLIIAALVTYFYLSFKANEILKDEKKRKEVENILRESEKRFRIMFELSPAGIILINEDGIIIEVNSSYCKIVGYTREEITGKNIKLFASPKYDGEVENNISSILTGKTMIHEVTNRRKDGSVCIVELYETMILLPDGKPGILSVSNDITEKKQSREKMRFLSLALESIGECVSITDFGNVILYVNNAFCKTYGYREDELIGKNILMLRVYENNDDPGRNILHSTISGGWSGELNNVKKDGSVFPIYLSTSTITDENNKQIALIGIAVDITDNRKAQLELVTAKEKAEESDRLKSSFLANMSHELRTPLNAIIGFSGIMAENNPDNETEMLSKIILKSGQHLLGLVEDILDISMIETGQVKVHYEEINIAPVLQEVKDIITGEIISENKDSIELYLNIEHSTGHRTIYTDGRKLKQVLINLLKNAVKFTEKGKVSFGITEVEIDGRPFMRFCVEDTGIGIDKKYHDVIFNVFRQVDDTHTRKFGGTGIGLSIARKIVEMLNGEIWVESELGKGSKFFFILPLVSSHLPEDKIFKEI